MNLSFPSHKNQCIAGTFTLVQTNDEVGNLRLVGSRCNVDRLHRVNTARGMEVISGDVLDPEKVLEDADLQRRAHYHQPWRKSAPVIKAGANPKMRSMLMLRSWGLVDHDDSIFISNPRVELRKQHSIRHVDDFVAGRDSKIEVSGELVVFSAPLLNVGSFFKRISG